MYCEYKSDKDIERTSIQQPIIESFSNNDENYVNYDYFNVNFNRYMNSTDIEILESTCAITLYLHNHKNIPTAFKTQISDILLKAFKILEIGYEKIIRQWTYKLILATLNLVEFKDFYLFFQEINAFNHISTMMYGSRSDVEILLKILIGLINNSQDSIPIIWKYFPPEELFTNSNILKCDEYIVTLSDFYSAIFNHKICFDISKSIIRTLIILLECNENKVSSNAAHCIRNILSQLPNNQLVKEFFEEDSNAVSSMEAFIESESIDKSTVIIQSFSIMASHNYKISYPIIKLFTFMAKPEDVSEKLRLNIINSIIIQYGRDPTLLNKDQIDDLYTRLFNIIFESEFEIAALSMQAFIQLLNNIPESMYQRFVLKKELFVVLIRIMDTDNSINSIILGLRLVERIFEFATLELWIDDCIDNFKYSGGIEILNNERIPEQLMGQISDFLEEYEICLDE